MNEFRKQVAVGLRGARAALWRSAANEVRLLLEQRLGLAKK